MLLNNFTQPLYKSHHVIIPATSTRGALLLGDLNAATDLQVIKQHNIKTIITAASGLQHLKIPSELTHVVFPLMDTKQQNISMYFQLSYTTIEQNLKRGAVLVHCGAGISRSASLIIAYYMKKYNQSFKNAIGAVKKIKPNICPNLGFELQLKSYQNSLSVQSEQHNNLKIQNTATVKPVFVSSPYLFQIPIKIQNQSQSKNSRQMNRVFNRTQGQKMHQNRDRRNQSQLFIEGKRTEGKQEEFETNFSLYEPEKYSRKHVLNQRSTVSTAKKTKQDSITKACRQ